MSTTKTIERALVAGHISRREFIERMSVIGAAAAIPSVLRSAQAAMPKRGGRLRVGAAGGSTTDSLEANAGILLPRAFGLPAVRHAQSTGRV